MANYKNKKKPNNKKGYSAKQKKNYYDKEQERAKRNYAKAMESIEKRFRDANQSSTISTIRSYEKETIRSYLQSPANNESGLRASAKYLYYRSQIFFRVINFYATMWDLRCRKVIPDYDLVKNNDATKMKKRYSQTLDQLQIYNIQNNMYPVLVNCYLYDVCYTIFFRDNSGAFFYILDPDECVLNGRYTSGEFAYSVDMSKWRNNQRQSMLEWLGEPLQSMYREYESTGNRYIDMPDEYGAAFKFRSDDFDHNIVPFASLLQQIVSLNDLEDLQAVANEASVFKLLLVPMKVLTGAKQSDDFQITPDLLLEYYDQMLKVLPDYVAAAPIPGEVTNDNVIDFSTTSTDKDIDRVEQSQNQILSTSGGGAVLASSNITSNAAFEAWMKSETEFAISSLMPQIEGFTNRMLSYDVSNPARVEYFPVSVYTKDDYAEKLLESCQYSFSNRLAYNTFLGIDEKTTLAMEFLETQVLDLPNLMNHPLQSSYTQSNTSASDEGGRPQKDDIELTDSGERTRNS